MRCRNGDAIAWEDLINRYQRLIYAIPRRAGLDDDSAAEVFQRTFVLLFEHLHRIEQPTRLQAWLVTTARRETWRLIRRLNSEQSLNETDANPDTEPAHTSLPDPQPLPDEAVALLEEQHLVRTALAQLEERCRRLLTLLFYRPDTPSYAEIAQRLGFPAGSLGPTRARCLQKLRQLLEGAGF